MTLDRLEPYRTAVLSPRGYVIGNCERRCVDDSQHHKRSKVYVNVTGHITDILSWSKGKHQLRFRTVGNPVLLVVTSRQVSSKDNGSIRSVCRLKISRTSRDTARYLVKFGATKVASDTGALLASPPLQNARRKLSPRTMPRTQLSDCPSMRQIRVFLSIEDRRAAQPMRRRHPCRHG